MKKLSAMGCSCLFALAFSLPVWGKGPATGQLQNLANSLGVSAAPIGTLKPFEPMAMSEVPGVRLDKQSGADLYYFSPRQAKMAAQFVWPWRRKPKSFFDSDVPAAIQSQMLADLAFISGIEGSGATPFHEKIFGEVDGPTYSKWFHSRVKSMGLNDCGMANAVACVIPAEDSSKMWITQNYIKFSHPQIARLMIVFHEARHTETENRNWSHANCPTPFKNAKGQTMLSIWTGAPLAGEPACDVTPFGSYGSSTILLKNIQKFCSNCTDKVKMDAGLYADDQMGRIIDDGTHRRMMEDLYQK